MLKIEILPQTFAVCKTKNIPVLSEKDRFSFLSVTDSEISLVCPQDCVPDGVSEREDGWRGFRIAGKLDFSLIGVLADITSRLAKEKISVFAVSTYDTDYIFTKSDMFGRAAAVLSENGYETDYGADI